VAKKGSLPLRHISRSPIADGPAMKEEYDSPAERYELFPGVTAAKTGKAREACAKRLFRCFGLLGEDVPQANVESFLDAQLEALLNVWIPFAFPSHPRRVELPSPCTRPIASKSTQT
jgi:hypothetical protein